MRNLRHLIVGVVVQAAGEVSFATGDVAHGSYDIIERLGDAAADHVKQHEERQHRRQRQHQRRRAKTQRQPPQLIGEA